jgi:hypothetical protein
MVTWCAHQDDRWFAGGLTEIDLSELVPLQEAVQKYLHGHTSNALVI